MSEKNFSIAIGLGMAWLAGSGRISAQDIVDGQMGRQPRKGLCFKSIINEIIDCLEVRLQERTPWEGLTIIMLSLLASMASLLIKCRAWAGLVYGA